MRAKHLAALSSDMGSTTISFGDTVIGVEGGYRGVGWVVGQGGVGGGGRGSSFTTISFGDTVRGVEGGYRGVGWVVGLGGVGGMG